MAAVQNHLFLKLHMRLIFKGYKTADYICSCIHSPCEQMWCLYYLVFLLKWPLLQDYLVFAKYDLCFEALNVFVVFSCVWSKVLQRYLSWGWVMCHTTSITVHDLWDKKFHACKSMLSITPQEFFPQPAGCPSLFLNFHRLYSSLTKCRWVVWHGARSKARSGPARSHLESWSCCCPLFCASAAVAHCRTELSSAPSRFPYGMNRPASIRT